MDFLLEYSEDFPGFVQFLTQILSGHYESQSLDYCVPNAATALATDSADPLTLKPSKSTPSSPN